MAPWCGVIWRIWQDHDIYDPMRHTALQRLLAATAIELGLVDELRMFRHPIIVGGGTPFLPPVTEDVPLELIETGTFGSRVIYERYRRVRGEID